MIVLREHLIAQDFSWEAVDKLCQYADLPFVPKEFERLREGQQEDVFPLYAAIFMEKEYEGLGWETTSQEFKRLEELSLIEEELPRIEEEKWRKLKEKWGREL